MKLFQQLLVAPAALGLLAPVAANAAELNINGVSEYTCAAEQVTSVTQFSDVYPTDWAYQALSNLVERYGCVAGYPNGTFRGNRAMTRYEAAALLNACLDRITEVTDELKRLMKEFERELAILKGRVDGLEARVGELEATQFSTTTKLKGKATFVIGANSYGGDYKSPAAPFAFDSFNLQNRRFVKNSDARKEILKKADTGAEISNEYLGATTFSYDYQLELLTSFTGKDLLKTRLRSGNFKNAFGFGTDTGMADPLTASSNLTSFSGMEAASDSGDNIVIDRLYYQFPLGSNFTITAGGKVRQDDMLAVWPSAYPTDTILDFFTYAGAPGAYNLNLGAGAGISWASNGWSVSANYVSGNGNVGKPSAVLGGTSYDAGTGVRDCGDSSGGIATDCASGTGTVQLAYTADNWGIAGVYNYSSSNFGNVNPATGTPLATAVGIRGNTDSFGLSAYWTPEESGWIPSISTGWGINTTTGADYGKVAGVDQYAKIAGFEFESATTQSWYVGLQWSDVFIKGNSAGMAVGQKAFVTDIDLSGVGGGTLATNNKSGDSEKILARDGQYAWEWWYMFQVTDNISVTPAIFYLSRPLGAYTQDNTFTQFGGLVKTTFKF